MANHTKTCPQCEETFTSVRSDARFCSKTCQTRNRKGTPHRRVCSDCGADISDRMGNARFCSVCSENRPAVHESSRKERAPEKVCPTCHERFRGYSKHCSRSCGGVSSRSAQLSREMTRECTACSATFKTRDVRVRQCSTACKVWTAKHGIEVPRVLDRECEFCGKSFTAANARFSHCSSRCARHAVKIRRRALMADAFVEPVTVRDLVSRDGWVCGICGGDVDMSFRHPHPESLTIDHVVPIALGGDHSLQNTQLAHNLCNTMKGIKLEGTY